jgi:hypothetical protein
MAHAMATSNFRRLASFSMESMPGRPFRPFVPEMRPPPSHAAQQLADSRIWCSTVCVPVPTRTYNAARLFDISHLCLTLRARQQS